MEIYAYLNMIIVLAIALLHVYWAMGGKKGINVAIPEKENGEKLFVPSPLASFAVAIAFICFAYLHYSYYHATPSIKQFSGYLLIIGAVVFLIRAIGDFKYVGFFKKIRNTRFAQNDTFFYSPLCLIISALTMAVYIFNGNS